VYKLAVRQVFRAYENAHCDELDAHFLNKNIPGSGNYGIRNLINHYKILLK